MSSCVEIEAVAAAVADIAREMPGLPIAGALGAARILFGYMRHVTHNRRSWTFFARRALVLLKALSQQNPQHLEDAQVDDGYAALYSNIEIFLTLETSKTGSLIELCYIRERIHRFCMDQERLWECFSSTQDISVPKPNGFNIDAFQLCLSNDEKVARNQPGTEPDKVDLDNRVSHRLSVSTTKRPASDPGMSEDALPAAKKRSVVRTATENYTHEATLESSTSPEPEPETQQAQEYGQRPDAASEPVEVQIITTVSAPEAILESQADIEQSKPEGMKRTESPRSVPEQENVSMTIHRSANPRREGISSIRPLEMQREDSEATETVAAAEAVPEPPWPQVTTAQADELDHLMIQPIHKPFPMHIQQDGSIDTECRPSDPSSDDPTCEPRAENHQPTNHLATAGAATPPESMSSAEIVATPEIQTDQVPTMLSEERSSKLTSCRRSRDSVSSASPPQGRSTRFRGVKEIAKVKAESPASSLEDLTSGDFDRYMDAVENLILSLPHTHPAWVQGAQVFQDQAAAGSHMALFFLGWIQFLGLGVPKSDASAFETWKKLLRDEPLVETASPHAAPSSEKDLSPLKKLVILLIKWGAVGDRCTDSPKIKLAEYGDPQGTRTRAFKYLYYWAIAGSDSDWFCELLIAICYSYGLGTPRNKPEFRKVWADFEKIKDMNAQYVIGYCYEHGTFVEVDHTKAARHYDIASQQLNLKAQYRSGLCHLARKDIKQNYDTAFKLISKAAKRGLPCAMNKLGELYEARKNVKNHMTRAAKYYKKAAEAGDARGQYQLGRCYSTGSGLKRCPKSALEWYRRAAAAGYPEAQVALGQIHSTAKALPI
ncbi:uncharacterized protein BJ171DRAFT_491199 [Polychytrium aggregatum]|uniref:uncharacterized protein n=1 Tax=Polychytrium aggregatum TaxID=110093 RepID=UPI0022FEEB6F|nr:uncharacterized protein BJ171DRAFT_491199 [Polychytrium aggregatum]KAI9208403.1 hypothetical protein BJ171DRAFT_491199 [Polychytrium aggregatum]